MRKTKKMLAAAMLLMTLSLTACGNAQENGSAAAGQSAEESTAERVAGTEETAAETDAEEAADDAAQAEQDAGEEIGEEEPADETESGGLLAEAAGTGDWLEGERFQSNASKESVQEWVDSLGL